MRKINLSPKFLVFSLFCSLLAACHCDDEQAVTTSVPSSCDLSSIYPQVLTPCDQDYMDSTLYCSHEYRGELRLAASSRSQLWYLCDEVLSLIYEDEDGNELELAKKSNIGISCIYFPFSICDSLNEKWTLYSLEKEVDKVNLSNEALGVKFQIELTPGERSSGNPSQDYDNLNIWVSGLQPNPGESRNNMAYRVYADTSTLIGISYEYAEQIELNGKLYKSVFYAVPSEQNSIKTELYYNKEYGLIAFKDPNGVTWYFKEYR